MTPQYARNSLLGVGSAHDEIQNLNSLHLKHGGHEPSAAHFSLGTGPVAGSPSTQYLNSLQCWPAGHEPSAAHFPLGTGAVLGAPGMQ